MITKPLEARIEDTDVPVPGPQEVQIRTAVSGISAGTEMGLYKGSNTDLVLRRWGPRWDYPMYPGYECVGRISECGPDVQGLKVGDRVISYGNHAEYSTARAELVVRLPDGVSDEQATLGILGTTSMHGVRRGQVEYGSTVAVVGMGTMGQMAIQHARLAGASRTVAVDMDPWRLEVAARLGADYVVNTADGDPEQAIRRFVPGGADLVIETAGVAAAIPVAMAVAKDGGRVVIVGWHLDSFAFVAAEDFLYKELDILASRGSGYVEPGDSGPRRWNTFKNRTHVIDLIARGAIRTDGLVTHVLPYQDVHRAYEIIRTKSEPSLQVALRWDGASERS